MLLFLLNFVYQLTATLVLVCIFVFVASEFSSSTSTPAVITPVLLGSDLRYYLHKSFSAACSEGSLAKVNVTSPPAVIEAQGIEVGLSIGLSRALPIL